ncbi:unnamed protein product [Phytophthora fragariaefolia]|uniref:Unnamed protein product n=1 Tax=Phytophthora fragariaefolia TaxID=1490495 RepID=A0A9W6XYP8_9STRA|nr:unnamed protein product [Phytophthora fragariaefolia]
MKRISISFARETVDGIAKESASSSSVLALVVTISTESLAFQRLELSTFSIVRDRTIDMLVRDLLNGLMGQVIPLFDDILVWDNVSIHTGVEEVARFSDYVGVELIKRSPNSPVFNHMENVFTVCF